MSDQSGQSHFQSLFEAAFRDYEKQTGKTLANHPLAEKLQSCDTIESVTAVLRERTETSSEIRGKDKVLKTPSRMSYQFYTRFPPPPLLILVSISAWYILMRRLGFDVPGRHSLASSTSEGNTHRPRYLCMCLPSCLSAHLRDIQTYQAVKGVFDDHDALADLLESVERFLNRLVIYTNPSYSQY
jgi:hypothetical protein